MVFLFYLIVLVFGVLQIILFFKLWGMTDDVKRIVGLMEHMCNNQTFTSSQEESSTEEKNGFCIDQLVVLKSTEDQMRIVSFPTDDTVECRMVTNGNIYTCQIDQIADFDRYWATKNKHLTI